MISSISIYGRTEYMEKKKMIKVEFNRTSYKWKKSFMYRLKGLTVSQGNRHRMIPVTYPIEFYWTWKINNPLSKQAKDQDIFKGK